jgi:hypothetical protein
MIEEIRELLDSYAAWVREKSSLREVDHETVEITTPYLDRNNDYLQIFAREESGELLLSDGGETIRELALSGCDLESPKRRSLFRTAVNGFGVRLKDDELQVSASRANFAVRKHNLVQAMLAVNDLFYLAKPTILSLFREDVEGWLRADDVRFLASVNLLGKTGFSYHFDFAIPASKAHGERLVNAISHPDKTSTGNLIFAWMDTSEVRSPTSRCFAMLNDTERVVPKTLVDALNNYGIHSFPWSQRDEALPALRG